MHIYMKGLMGAVLLSVAVLIPTSAYANTESVEESVRAYFKDTPVMIEIARCESKFRQFSNTGAPLQGGWGNKMIGVFQLFESVHQADAKLLGFDLSALEGNMAYAKYLYTRLGTSPWNSSKSCWDVPLSVVGSKTTSDSDHTELLAEIAKLTKLITELQQLLEARKVALGR